MAIMNQLKVGGGQDNIAALYANLNNAAGANYFQQPGAPQQQYASMMNQWKQPQQQNEQWGQQQVARYGMGRNWYGDGGVYGMNDKLLEYYGGDPSKSTGQKKPGVVGDWSGQFDAVGNRLMFTSPYATVAETAGTRDPSKAARANDTGVGQMPTEQKVSQQTQGSGDPTSQGYVKRYANLLARQGG